jgi:PRTRC genetic system protein C
MRGPVSPRVEVSLILISGCSVRIGTFFNYDKLASYPRYGPNFNGFDTVSRFKKVMSIATHKLEPSFSYRSVQLPDPDPVLTPEQVTDLYSATYPGTYNRRGFEGPEATDGTLQYKFRQAVGTKG